MFVAILLIRNLILNQRWREHLKRDILWIEDWDHIPKRKSNKKIHKDSLGTRLKGLKTNIKFPKVADTQENWNNYLEKNSQYEYYSGLVLNEDKILQSLETNKMNLPRFSWKTLSIWISTEVVSSVFKIKTTNSSISERHTFYIQTDL